MSGPVDDPERAAPAGPITGIGQHPSQERPDSHASREGAADSAKASAGEMRKAQDSDTHPPLEGREINEEKQATPTPANVAPEYPAGLRYWLAVSALCLAIFLLTLDSTIITTATPYITNDFHSLGDIGWYANIYPLAIAMSQMSYAKLSTRYSLRWIYSIAMLLFTIGSAVCASAPRSSILILGRAISGLGASGLLIGAYSLVAHIAPPAKRPTLFSLFSASRGIAVTCGPLIGGALTQHVSWRWNFYINLPLGAVIYLVFLYSVRPGKRQMEGFTSWKDLVETLDPVGLAALLGWLACLLLALQWGGIQYAWGSGRIIALLVVSVVCAVAFVFIEYRRGGKAMLPARVFMQPTVLSASSFALCATGAIFTITYYLPIWLQAVKQKTPLASGVATLPWVITSTITALISGVLIGKVGHTAAFMVIGAVFGCIGSGLFTLFQPNTSSGKWIGYQILYAVGSSLASYTPLVAAQSSLPLHDIPIGAGMVTLSQTIGSALFVSIAQALFTNGLSTGLQSLGIGGFDASTVATGGIGSLTKGLDSLTKARVIGAINEALTSSWKMAVILSCVSIIGAVGVQYSTSRQKPTSPEAAAAPAQDKPRSEGVTDSTAKKPEGQ